jgi:hypothetical protein
VVGVELLVRHERRSRPVPHAAATDHRGVLSR